MTRIFPPPVTTVDKGHGRIEIRKIRTSTLLNDYIDFPYAQQIFKIERTRMKLDGTLLDSDVAYGITSHAPQEAGPERLLTLVRGQWRIENCLHWVRDVTFDEDRSQIRTKAGPRVFATLRNLVISLLRLCGHENIAEGLRSYSWLGQEQAVELLGL